MTSSSHFGTSREFLTVPVFDAAQFGALTLGDAGLQSLLLASFLREAPRMGLALRDGHGDAQAFAELLHKLRSSVHFVAGRRLQCRLAQLGAAGELARDAAARAQAGEQIAAELEVLRGILSRVSESLPAPDA